MDEGGYARPLPPLLTPVDLIENSRKAQSLPGYYRRPTSPPQGFRDAFAASYAPYPRQSEMPLPLPPPQPYGGHPVGSRGRSPPSIPCPPVPPPAGEKNNVPPEEKKSRRFLGGLFRRRRKDSHSSSSGSDSEGPPRRRFFSRKAKKKEEESPVAKATDLPLHYPPTPPRDMVNLSVSAHQFRNQTTYLVATDTGKLIKMSPTGSLGREVSGHYALDGQQPLGIPQLAPNLGRPGVSMSHDSLAVSASSWNSESAYGSINSSMRSSALGRSSSTDTISRRGRKEALKARVERLRDRSKGSSSEEDGASLSSQFGSESSLNKGDTSSLKRTRSSRTERYIRRKSLELETLRIETEKDRKNREAVQARILEIQMSQKAGAQRKAAHMERRQWAPGQRHPQQEGVPNPPEGGAVISPRTPSRHQYIVKRLSDVCDQQRQVPLGHFVQGNPPMSLESQVPARRNDHSFSSMQGHQRSVSYESNINRQTLPPQYANRPFTNSEGVVPPAPPPRDKSSFLSPFDYHRPISYSFENLNQENRRTPAPPNRTDALLSPVPSSRGGMTQLPPATPCRRSFSEKHLNLSDGPQGYSSLPGRPALPKVYNAQISPQDQNQFKHVAAPVTPFAPRPFPSVGGASEKNAQYGKVVPNIPASPSSDYSSYVSDNSLRLQQSAAPQAFIHAEGGDRKSILKKGVTPLEISRSNSPKPESSIGKSRSVPYDVAKPRSVAKANDLATPPGQSDIPNPQIDDSDSTKDPTKRLPPQTRPLSMVLEKSEDKVSPPLLQKPQPPKRGSSSISKGNRELMKQQLQSLKEDPKQSPASCERKFKEFFLKEKERLEKSKSANFEEALQELESIYRSLNLGSEDIMEGAERRESEGEEAPSRERGRSRTPKPKRSPTPDKTRDDFHLRRVQLNNRNIPDTKKNLQMSGSYLLVSPVHGPSPAEPPSLLPRDPSLEKEPDVISDDVIVRSVTRANALKVLDPQPPFGIPVGPVTQGPRSDYLNDAVPRDPPAARGEPDTVADDMAFRSLRKDGDSISRSTSNKSLNASEGEEAPLPRRGAPRSRSVPRSVERASPAAPSSRKGAETRTPRKVKQQKARKAGTFYDSFRDALTDSDNSRASTPFGPRRNPSWVQRANLDTSTETLTEASLRAVSQPDIRDAIIREAMFPSGLQELHRDSSDEEEVPFKSASNSIPVNSVQMDRKQYRPLDAIFNPKPRPFYLNDKPGSTGALSKSKADPLDIAKLDNLISALSEMESKPATGSKDPKSGPGNKDPKSGSGGKDLKSIPGSKDLKLGSGNKDPKSGNSNKDKSIPGNKDPKPRTSSKLGPGNKDSKRKDSKSGKKDPKAVPSTKDVKSSSAVVKSDSPPEPVPEPEPDTSTDAPDFETAKTKIQNAILNSMLSAESGSGEGGTDPWYITGLKPANHERVL